MRTNFLILALALLAANFAHAGETQVTFSVGSKPMGGEPGATYELDKTSPDNHFMISAVRGKVFEGTFQFRLKDQAGKAIALESGKFVAKDRQL